MERTVCEVDGGLQIFEDLIPTRQEESRQESSRPERSFIVVCSHDGPIFPDVPLECVALGADRPNCGAWQRRCNRLASGQEDCTLPGSGEKVSSSLQRSGLHDRSKIFHEYINISQR